MVKYKPNEVVYNVLLHHINHYIQVKKIFKTDYDSHMISITVFAHFLYGTLNPSHEKYLNKDLDWSAIFPAAKGLSKDQKKYINKLSLFAMAQILNMPKETVRRKVINLCKKKLLDYSVKDGITIGDNWEQMAQQIAPKDINSLNNAIKAIDKNGGVYKILKSMKK